MAPSDDIPDTTLVGTLPGEIEVDPPLLEELLEELELHSRGQGLQTALAIADCVLGRLFKRDSGLLSSRSRNHETFKALQNDSSLPISKSSLWYALAVKHQYQQLPRSFSERLSLAQHKVLLRVKSVNLKVDLARRAIQEELSKRDLERLVRRRCREDEVRGRGRPPLPAVVKGMRQLVKATDLATSEPLSTDALRSLDQAGIAQLLQSLDQNIQALNALGSQLRRLANDLED
ncbi:MAG: hypothetical protein JRI25_22490 [Deltaproteobacteria bacterium]|nr:hypothetical protein [Deltaproteobacteria bacterium]